MYFPMAVIPLSNEFLHMPKYIRYNILENKIYNNQ